MEGGQVSAGSTSGIGAGSSANVTLDFPGSVGTAGQQVFINIKGSRAAGTFAMGTFRFLP